MYMFNSKNQDLEWRLELQGVGCGGKDAAPKAESPVVPKKP
jgi:hypothetical protein